MFTENQLEVHKSICKSQPPKKSGPTEFTCKKCGKNFAGQLALVRHLQNDHPVQKTVLKSDNFRILTENKSKNLVKTRVLVTVDNT